MKKIYSILALALALGAGEANAQVAEKVFEASATPAQIQEYLTSVEATGVGQINVEAVTANLKSTTFEMKGQNTNAIIIAKAWNKPANATNVVYVWNSDKEYGCDEFVLTDGYPFLATQKFDAVKASYTRIVKNEYNTVCVPFCFKYEKQREGEHFEILTKVEDDLLTFKRIDKTQFDIVKGLHHVAAMTPMVVHLHDFDYTEGAENKVEIVAQPSTINGSEDAVYEDLAYSLTGTLTDYSLTGDFSEYYIQDNKFWAAEDFQGVDVFVPAYRCVLKNVDLTPKTDEQPEVKVYSIVSEDGETTVIKSVSTASSTAAYNLQGVRVAADAKGFVIMNGKKHFNK